MAYAAPTHVHGRRRRTLVHVCMRDRGIVDAAGQLVSIGTAAARRAWLNAHGLAFGSRCTCTLRPRLIDIILRLGCSACRIYAYHGRGYRSRVFHAAPQTASTQPQEAPRLPESPPCICAFRRTFCVHVCAPPHHDAHLAVRRGNRIPVATGTRVPAWPAWVLRKSVEAPPIGGHK